MHNDTSAADLNGMRLEISKLREEIERLNKEVQRLTKLTRPLKLIDPSVMQHGKEWLQINTNLWVTGEAYFENSMGLHGEFWYNNKRMPSP